MTGPRTIEKQLLLLQWLLPFFLFGFVTYYEVNEHVVERQENLSANLAGEIWFFGLLGPALVWLVLFWVRREWRERERVQSDLRLAYEKVTHAQHELQRLHDARGQLLQRVMGAQEAERVRIAREVHDQIGQSLTGLQFALKLAEDSIAAQPAQATAHLVRAQAVIDQLLTLAHQLALDLRPAALDDVGLAAAIRGYAQQRLEPAGIQTEVSVDGPPPQMSPARATELFRIIQEALTNVIKHAKASHVSVCLSQSDGVVRAAIEDDGRGFETRLISEPDADGRGLGLLGMRERATLVDGRLSIESRPGHGTVVRVEVPAA